jgi:hypothetical protein
LKLDRSVAEARERGAEVGAGGWTKLALDRLPPLPILRRWIAESHEIMSRRPGAKKKKTSAAGKPSKRKRRDS